MASDWEGLLPVNVARDVIASAQQQSAALALGSTRPMPGGVTQIPIVSAVPTAGWVEAGQRKPITEVQWSAETLKAEELAAITYVPDVYLSDTSGSWDVEASVEAELAGAIARAVDAAVLFGTNAPASFPTGGVQAAATAVSGDDALGAIDAGMSVLEGSGLAADGVASSTAIGGALRAAYREVGALPGDTPEPQVYGIPVRTVAGWDSSAADALVGGWSYLQIGVRQDISFERSTDAVLFDEEGELVVSAFQDDVTVVRITFRLGAVIGSPLKADGSGPADVFAAATWTS
jgi:Phage capsid family